MPLRAGSKRRSEWVRVDTRPLRWERAGLGAIEKRGRELWVHLPVCGHDYYASLSLLEALELAEERSGLCFRCWYPVQRERECTRSGVVPVDRGRKRSRRRTPRKA